MSRAEAFRRVQQELRQAQAEALGRTGERLGAILEEIAGLDRRLDDLLGRPSMAAGRPAGLLEARHRLRGEALELVRTLLIQREALGVRTHAIVAEQYPVPPRRAGGPDRGNPGDFRDLSPETSDARRGRPQ